MAIVVDIQNLELAYPTEDGDRTILADLDLAIAQGEFVAIIGPSGVGKSTLLRVVAGLADRKAGTVDLHTRPAPDRRPTALVFQEPRLLPWRRALPNVTLGLEGLALDRDERRRRAAAALALVGLAEHGGRWPYQLSGGQRQRVGLARALAVSPDLLLMDEPFSALDAITRRRLQDELLRIWNETRTSILFVTHDIDEAVYLADRVLLLGGSPASVVGEYTIAPARPRHRESRDFQRLVERIKGGLYASHAEEQSI